MRGFASAASITTQDAFLAFKEAVEAGLRRDMRLGCGRCLTLRPDESRFLVALAACQDNRFGKAVAAFAEFVVKGELDRVLLRAKRLTEELDEARLYLGVWNATESRSVQAGLH